MREFWRSEGLREATFYHWRRELERPGRPTPAFLPVHVANPQTDRRRTQGDPPARGAIEVVLAEGRCLRIPPGLDPQTFVQVLDLLERGGR